MYMNVMYSLIYWDMLVNGIFRGDAELPAVRER